MAMIGRRVIPNTAVAVGTITAGVASILITAAFVQLYINTQHLLVCRQRIAASGNATQEDLVNLERLKQSFWAKLPKAAFAVVAGVAGIVSFAGFGSLATVVTHRLITKWHLTRSEGKEQKPDDQSTDA
jgi:hypothetical protein